MAWTLTLAPALTLAVTACGQESTAGGALSASDAAESAEAANTVDVSGEVVPIEITCEAIDDSRIYEDYYIVDASYPAITCE